MSTLLFEEQVKTNRSAFVAKVRDIAARLGVDPNWLMGTMYFESGLLPTAHNPSGATGLIQFMPSTARDLGTTTAALAKLTNVEQLDYVYAYFKPATGKLETWFDLYLWVFYPAAIGKPDSYELGNSPAAQNLIARQNSVFDMNWDGKLTKGEVRAGYLQKLPVGYQVYLNNQKKSG